MKNSYFHSLKTFSFTEIVIIVIILLLLVGGTIKGLRILENKRIQKTGEQIRLLSVAWYNYIYRHQQIPGDDNQTSNNLKETTQKPNGDGILSPAEQPLVWQHLYLSNSLQGNTQEPVRTPWENEFSFLYDKTKNQHLLCIKNFLGSRAKKIDTQNDDGSPNSGRLFINEEKVNSYSLEKNITFCSKL